jgi:hypothetical protein
MGRFCENCGTKLNDIAVFCGECGRAVANQSHNIGSSSVYNMPGYIGFSERINDPEVMKEIEDSNKKGRGCIFIGIPLPLVIFLVVSLVSDEVGTLDALVFGGGISVVFLLFYLFSNFLSNAKRSWDGIVIDKKSKNKSRRMRDGDIQNYIQYTIYFRTDSGKKEVSVSRSNGNPECRDYYDYLNVGDRVRYYPQLRFSYEKYDKSHDRVIPCMFCKTMNDIQKDRCEACNCLLFK